MPIRPDLRPFYRGAHWRAIQARIRERAWNRCEQCGKPNREQVSTISGRDWMYWRASMGYWTDETGKEFPQLAIAESDIDVRRIRVQLHVAHLNHTPGDDRDENLKLLCQWCHFHYDKHHHQQTRAQRKDARRPLLAPIIPFPEVHA
jgi:hypothetical protein